MKQFVHTLLLFFVLPVVCLAADPGFQAGLNAEDRPAEDKERDANRKPGQVIEFLGVEAGMTALDVIAASGYYTEVLSAAVGKEGTVVSQNTAGILQRGGAERVNAIKDRVQRLGNVEMLVAEIAPARPPGGAMGGGMAGMGGAMGMAPTTAAPNLDPHSTSLTDYEGKIDVAITALNFHDLYIFGGDAGASGMLANIYKLLKPGGTLGLIDHVGVAGQDNNALHRIEKSKVREFLTQAGFEIDGESNVLANPADDHTLHMRDESLDRNTDRMVIKAVKPAM